MRHITKEELDLILKEHREWLDTRNNEEVEGKQADLHDVDLSRADLSYANLSLANLNGTDLLGANLSYANLWGADLIDADLNCANLEFADLSDAILIQANLSKANIHHARLRNTNLHYTNLIGADLSEANLTNAVLTGADLTGVNLTDASLYHANLYQAELTGANLDMPDLCNANLTGAILDPKEQIRFGVMLKEDMTGFKKCRINPFSEFSADCIVELVIPKGSIVFSINNNKCRTNRAKVVSITDIDNAKSYPKAYSYYDAGFVYEVGQEVESEDFDCRYNVECGSGIHFFRKRIDAEQY